MSYTDLRDFEPEYTVEVPAVFMDDTRDLTIEIAALGGGTVGRAYAGTWRAVVTYAGHEIYRGQDLDTGVPYTHLQAAGALADFLAHSQDRDCEGSSLRERLCLFSTFGEDDD